MTQRQENKSLRPYTEMPEDENHFVSHIDVESNNPYIEISDNRCADVIKYACPRSLAYYLSHHWSGTQLMKREREKNIIRGLRNQLREMFLFDEED